MSAEPALLVSEIFHSLQGESSLVGLPFAFIRLSGCDLRCTYCDSTYAHQGGEKLSIPQILEKIAPFRVQHVLLTGGEPILQKHTLALIKSLRARDYEVSVETHGEISIQEAAPLAHMVMDIKTPGSGVIEEKWRENLKWLKPTDEIKFVITSPQDYVWARDLVRSEKLPTREIIFSPVQATETTQTQSYPGIEPRWLAEQILKDHLLVRFQLQLHKLLWGPNTRGV